MALAHLTKHLAQQAIDTLSEHNGNRARAATALGLARSTFQNRLEIAAARYGLKAKEKNPTLKQTEAQSATDMLLL